MAFINFLRKSISNKRNEGIILLLIICLSLSAALMHYIFIIITKENIHWAFNYQKGLIFYPNEEGRILSGFVVYLLYLIIKQEYLALILAEFIFAIFSYWAMFSVAKKTIKDDRFALFSIYAMALFTPLSYQLASFRYGEFLLFGFYMAFILFVINKNEMLFFLLLFIAAIQRPETAIAAVFFKVIYEYYDSKNALKTIYNILLIVIPFVALFAVNKYYGISTSGYFSRIFMVPFLGNLKGAVLYGSVYAPLVFLTVFNFRKFDKLVYLMLIALIPHFIVLTISANYSEPRIFFPFVSVLIIGVCGAIKNKGYLSIDRLIS